MEHRAMLAYAGERIEIRIGAELADGILVGLSAAFDRDELTLGRQVSLEVHSDFGKSTRRAWIGGRYTLGINRYIALRLAND